MSLPSLFKLPPHKMFNFKTRYYNADKEEFEDRVERAKRDAGVTSAVMRKVCMSPTLKDK